MTQRQTPDTYAIVKTGGKQYRVEKGQTLLVERLRVDQGEKVALQPLFYRSDDALVDGADELAKVKVEAKVVGHERGPKIRVFKFKPKRGYRRHQGHRQELTRLEVTGIVMGARKAASKPDGSKPAASKAGGAKAASKPAVAKPARKKPTKDEEAA